MMIDEVIIYTAMILAFAITLNLSYSIWFSSDSLYQYYISELVNTTALSLRPSASISYFTPLPVSIYGSSIGKYSVVAKGLCGGTCIVISKFTNNTVEVTTCDF